MPEIRIRYEDDSDRMPHEAIAEIVRTAGAHLQVTEIEWTRDDDQPGDEPGEVTYAVRPDTRALEAALIDRAWARAGARGGGFVPYLGSGA